MTTYKYVLSLPERVLRSLSALAGGILREAGVVVLPAAVRRTTLYRTMVEVTLRFLIEEVGQVEDVYAPADGSVEGGLARNFLLRRTASHGIELLGLVTMHASPVWVLAALADATGAGHNLIREISQTLEEEGLLEHGSRFESMDQILDGLERTTAHLALTLNMPPVDIAGLRREWQTLREALPKLTPANVPSVDRLEGIWAQMRAASRAQGRPLFVVSSLMAVSSLAHVPSNLLWLSRAARSAAMSTGRVLGGPLLDHYANTLDEISTAGFIDYWKREFHPYLRAAARQFLPARKSLTERIIGAKI